MPSRAINDLLPEVAAKCMTWQKECNLKLGMQGYSVLITCTYRSQAEQNALYAKGRTQPGRKVTWTRRSKHTKRIAWDVCFLKNGKVTYAGPWAVIGEIAEKHGITWGGSWKVIDQCHFQVGT